MDADDGLTGRTTLYWLPDIPLKKISGQQFTLPSANVSVLIEGLTPDGTVIRYND